MKALKCLFAHKIFGIQSNQYELFHFETERNKTLKAMQQISLNF